MGSEQLLDGLYTAPQWATTDNTRVTLTGVRRRSASTSSGRGSTTPLSGFCLSDVLHTPKSSTRYAIPSAASTRSSATFARVPTSLGFDASLGFDTCASPFAAPDVPVFIPDARGIIGDVKKVAANRRAPRALDGDEDEHARLRPKVPRRDDVAFYGHRQQAFAPVASQISIGNRSAFTTPSDQRWRFAAFAPTHEYGRLLEHQLAGESGPQAHVLAHPHAHLHGRIPGRPSVEALPLPALYEAAIETPQESQVPTPTLPSTAYANTVAHTTFPYGQGGDIVAAETGDGGEGFASDQAWLHAATGTFAWEEEDSDELNSSLTSDGWLAEGQEPNEADVGMSNALSQPLMESVALSQPLMENAALSQPLVENSAAFVAEALQSLHNSELLPEWLRGPMSPGSEEVGAAQLLATMPPVALPPLVPVVGSEKARADSRVGQRMGRCSTPRHTRRVQVQVQPEDCQSAPSEPPRTYLRQSPTGDRGFVVCALKTCVHRETVGAVLTASDDNPYARAAERMFQHMLGHAERTEVVELGRRKEATNCKICGGVVKGTRAAHLDRHHTGVYRWWVSHNEAVKAKEEASDYRGRRMADGAYSR